MDQEYINRKIAKCQKLVDNATSEAQKEIYQGYLDYWITKSNRKTDTETGERVSTPLTKEAEFKFQFPNKNAYYTRDGITHKTKAFKEFLISNQ